MPLTLVAMQGRRDREKEREEPKSLDDLFHKTKAKPEIYWKENCRETQEGRMDRLRARGGLPPPIQ